MGLLKLKVWLCTLLFPLNFNGPSSTPKRIIQTLLMISYKCLLLQWMLERGLKRQLRKEISGKRAQNKELRKKSSGKQAQEKELKIESSRKSQERQVDRRSHALWGLVHLLVILSPTLLTVGAYVCKNDYFHFRSHPDHWRRVLWWWCWDIFTIRQ